MIQAKNRLLPMFIRSVESVRSRAARQCRSGICLMRKESLLIPRQQEENSTLVFSYLTLRKAIGHLGLAVSFMFVHWGIRGLPAVTAELH